MPRFSVAFVNALGNLKAEFFRDLGKRQLAASDAYQSANPTRYDEFRGVGHYMMSQLLTGSRNGIHFRRFIHEYGGSVWQGQQTSHVSRR